MSRADVFVSLAPRGMSLLLSRLHSVHHKSSSLGTSEIQCTGWSTFHDLSSERTFEYKWHSWTTGLRGNGYRWVFRYMSIINLEEYNQIDLMNWITFIWSNNVGQHVCLQWGLQWSEVKPFTSDPYNAWMLCVLHILLRLCHCGNGMVLQYYHRPHLLMCP